MDILALLGVALGLASLSGVNLYLTVLVTGLSVRFEWVHLADQFQSLNVLGHPVVIMVAGLLFALEFLADKIPWVDTLWDSVHTVIRPVGGVLLALQAVGDMPGYVQVIAALLAGGVALTTHSAKAGTRLLINHSPEPVTNVAMSLAEDVAVVGGVYLTLLKPVIALVVFGAIIVAIWFFYPRLWRLIRSTLWLAWHKLKLPGGTLDPARTILRPDINDELRDVLRFGAALDADEVAWNVPCLSGRGKGVRGLCANLDGMIVAPVRPDCIYFAAPRGLRSRLFKIPLDGARLEVESRFLSENVILTGAGVRAVFRFPRGHQGVAEAVADRLREASEKKPALPAGLLSPQPEPDEPASTEEPGPSKAEELDTRPEAEAPEKLGPLPISG